MKDRVTTAASFILLLALIQVLYMRGGPFFRPPATIFDHVFVETHEARDAMLVLPRVRPMLPRGAKVTCFRPANGKWQWDVPDFHAAITELPQQVVWPPFSASEDIPKANLVDYVIAIDAPFTHPAYRLEADVPPGRLYKVVR